MFKTFINAIKVRDIRRKILYTFVALIIVRLGCQIVVPGISKSSLDELLDQVKNLDFITAFTGDAFTRMSIFALGITPYITSSIIMQLLTIAIPKLEEMQKDGEDGRKKIAEITRYVTVILALIESIAISIGLRNQLTLSDMPGGENMVIAMMVLSMTAGSAFLMWLGERITQKGIGNGISIILLINIVSRVPADCNTLIDTYIKGDALSTMDKTIAAIIIFAVIAFVVVFVIYLSDGERRIPVQYAKKLQGRKQIGGQSTYIPLKVNTAGVIPVIFTTSLLQLPIVISKFFGINADVGGTAWQKVLYFISTSSWFRFSDKQAALYSLGVLVYLVLLVFFAYFYTSITFNPIEVSNNMKKQGGFVPGIRPGKPTTEYLTGVLNNIILIGATGLAIVALVPMVFEGRSGINISFGGTSIIIIVGVILETMKQVESQMLVRHYKGFLSEKQWSFINDNELSFTYYGEWPFIMYIVSFIGTFLR